MKLRLTHAQRLNLIALLGIQRATVDATRVIWRLQDKLALSSEEAEAIQLQTRVVDGREISIWSADASIPEVEFELSDIEVVLIREALKTWADCPVQARPWLEPLLDALG